MERWRVTDPTGTPLNVRDVHMKIIGLIENGWILLIRRYGETRKTNDGSLSDRLKVNLLGGYIASSLAVFEVSASH